jgi:hypothetical protein
MCGSNVLSDCRVTLVRYGAPLPLSSGSLGPRVSTVAVEKGIELRVLDRLSVTYTCSRLWDHKILQSKL